MKVAWKKNDRKKRPLAAISKYPNLPFDQPESEGTDVLNRTAISNTHNNGDDGENKPVVVASKEQESDCESNKRLAESFQDLGNKLAEERNYREAIGKWEAALNITPENAVLHEQKAQVLLEFGDAWSALKATTRATELQPSWAEAWITLGRAQLNFGEPDNAIESFDKALALKPELVDAQDDRHTALQLVKRRKQLHGSGLSTNTNCYTVSDTYSSSNFTEVESK